MGVEQRGSAASLESLKARPTRTQRRDAGTGKRGGVSAWRRIGVAAWRRGGVAAWRRAGVPACRRISVREGRKDICEGSETGKIQFLVYSKPFKTFVTFSDLCELLYADGATPPRRHAKHADTPIRRHADTPARRYADTPARWHADTRLSLQLISNKHNELFRPERSGNA